MDTKWLYRPLRMTAPVMASYVAIGLASGVVLFDVGFNVFEIFLISMFVYSGAGQFLIASMILLGASIPSIILTTLFLNIRHILMSASMAEYVKDENQSYLFLFGITLTDESYGLNYTYFQNDYWTANDAMVVNIANYASWVLSNVIGGAIGSVLQIDTTIMSFAVVALFISMAVNQFISKKYIFTAGIALVLTIIFNIILQHNISIVIAAMISSFIGYYIDTKIGKNREGEAS